MPQYPSSSSPSSSQRPSSNHARQSSEMQTIPVEIFQQILENVPKTTLTAVARTNTSFNEVSEKLIYRNLDLTTIQQTLQCYQSLQKKPQAAQSVRELVIMIKDTRDCAQRLGPILSSMLRSLTQLTALHLAIEGPYLPALNGCLFPRLTTFSSTADLSPNPSPLAEFLIRHPSINSLCLGGDVPPAGSDPRTPLPTFSLPASALPGLTSYMGSRRLVPTLIPGRPVRKVTLAWHSPNVELEVGCIVPPLSLTSLPILSFSVATPGWSSVLVRTLACSIPALQSLRIQNISADYHNEAEIFTTFSDTLSSFPELSRLEIPCHRNVRSILDVNAEANTAKQWADLAPCLQVVVFPSSRAWRRSGKGSWEPLQKR